MKLSNKENIEAWDNYDEMEVFGDEGDLSRQYILTPTIYKEITFFKGVDILDAGCGTGYLSRKLASDGASVVGVEPSKNLFEYCVKREEKEKLGIKYYQQDISELNLKNKFDYVVANMVLQDIFLYEQAIRNLIRVLNPGGKLIFSILHPLFDSLRSSKGYLTNYSVKQKFGHSYHRTIEQYFDVINQSGGNVVKILEPKPLEEARNIKELESDFLNPTFIFFVVKKLK